MASHYDIWDDGTLQLKLALVALVAVLVAGHMRRPRMHVLEVAMFLLSLVIVWLGLTRWRSDHTRQSSDQMALQLGRR